MEASRSPAAKKAYGSPLEETVIKNLGPAPHPVLSESSKSLKRLDYKEIEAVHDKSIEGGSPSIQFSEGPIASLESKEVFVEPSLRHCKLNSEEAMAMEHVKLHSIGIDAASHPFHASISPVGRDPKRCVSLELEHQAPSLRSVQQQQHHQLNQQQLQRSAYARNTASSASIVSEEQDLPMYLSFSCKERLAINNNHNNNHHGNVASNNNGNRNGSKDNKIEALRRCGISDDIEHSIYIKNNSKYIAGRSVRHSSYSSPVSQNEQEECQIRDQMDYDDEKHSSPCP